jgi:tripartite-type tricarboxylate transporter receptor subunit TctC
MNTKILAAAVAMLAALTLVGPAAADDYPSKPVRIVVPANAGGASDIYARLLASKLSPILGRPFVVDNRVGASGRIGYEHAAKSAPDGYTLIIATSAMLLHRAMYLSLPYDPVEDFVPISLIARNQQLMVIPAALPANDLRSFIALVKASPSTHNFASSGVGNPPHLAAELLCAMAGLQMTHIPYSGDAPAIVDLLAGRVSMYLGSVAPAAPHVHSGKLRAIAVTGPARSPAFPNVPTMVEAGLPGYNVSGWFGILAPRGTPPAVVARLNEAIVQVMAMPEVRHTISDSGIEPVSSSAADFAREIPTGLASYREIMRIAGIKPEP